MHAVRPLLLSLCLVGALLTTAGAQQGRQGLAVCPRPSDRCDSPAKSFAAWELPFRLPQRLTDNALYESAPFYAVVLRKNAEPPCDEGEYTRSVEQFRKQAQKLFPGQKVFADQGCPDMGAVSYAVDGVAKDRSYGPFVAVYAGKTAGEARGVLQKASARYPGAVLKRLRVSYSPIVQ